MEGWDHSLKVEVIHGERFVTRAQAKAQVLEYIEVDYNRDRPHSTLGYVSPEQFERAHAAYPGVREAGAGSTIVMQELDQRQAVLKLDQVDSHENLRSGKRAASVCLRHRNPTKTG